MRKLIKITAVVMAILMCCAVFASCGGGDSSSEGGKSSAAETVKGKTETWGNITVLVPEGMTLKGGSILDKEDPNVVNIAKDDNAMNYFLITVNDDEEGAKSGIDSTRELNEDAKDVSFTAGADWTGVSYDFSGTPMLHIYGKVDGKIVIIQSYGFKSDEDTTKSVLGSLKISAK